MNNTAPCKGCNERKDMGICHDSCEKYIEFKEINQVIAENRKELKNSISNITRTGIKRAKVY